MRDRLLHGLVEIPLRMTSSHGRAGLTAQSAYGLPISNAYAIALRSTRGLGRQVGKAPGTQPRKFCKWGTLL